MDESTKHLLDATSIFTAVGTMLSWLPHLASLFTIVWLGIRIYETKTVQTLVKGKPKVAKVEPRKPQASSNRVKKQTPTVSKKQEKFMQAVANNPKFAKKVGVNQSIGQEFTKENGMKKNYMYGGKVKKMMGGGMADKRGRAMTRMGADAGGRAMMNKGGATMAAKGKKMAAGGNTSRMNRTEELGRVDAERADTASGRRNLREEKSRIRGELGMKMGGATADKMGRAMAKDKKGMTDSQMSDAAGRAMKKGGKVKKQGYNARLDDSLGARKGKKKQSMKARRDESKGMKKSAGKKAYSGNRKSAQGSASKRADGIARKGRTKGRMV